MIKLLKSSMRSQLVILSREDGEGPRRLRAAFINNLTHETPERSLASLGMTK